VGVQCWEQDRILDSDVRAAAVGVQRWEQDRQRLQAEPMVMLEAAGGAIAQVNPGADAEHG
jgi:hypothetical protein